MSADSAGAVGRRDVRDRREPNGRSNSVSTFLVSLLSLRRFIAGLPGGVVGSRGGCDGGLVSGEWCGSVSLIGTEWFRLQSLCSFDVLF